jgi:hypothetical protein
MKQPMISITLRFIEPGLTVEERDRQVRHLFAHLSQVDPVERVQRVVDPHPPKDHMGGGFLLDLLNLEVSWPNFLTVMSFLGDRLGSKPIELEIEVKQTKLKVIASSRAEFDLAIQKANEFVSAHAPEVKQHNSSNDLRTKVPD